MKRLNDGEHIHFAGACGHTLCGVATGHKDLIGELVEDFGETPEPVTCPVCAELYCRIKNAPWGDVDHDVLMDATYAAVLPQGGHA